MTSAIDRKSTAEAYTKRRDMRAKKDKKNQRFNNSSVNENSRDDTQEV